MPPIADAIKKVKYPTYFRFKGEIIKLKENVQLLLLFSLLSSLILITPAPTKASFDTSQAAYYDEVKSVLSLTPEQEAMLEKYGFVIVELEPEEVNPTITDSLQTLKDATQKLEVISEKELAKEPLTEEEVEFIKMLVWNCGSGGFIGWYVDTIHAIAQAANSTSTLEVPVIADVATFPPGDIEYPPQILHVGTGYVNALVVLFPMPNGTLVTAVGPVFSYYEFNLIGTERLNDDEWKEMLTWSNRTEYLPDWLQDVYGLAEPMPIPENLNFTMFVVLAVSTLTVLAVMK